MAGTIVPPELVEIRPQPGPQERFLASPADIVVYGGQAGRREDLGPAARAGAASWREGFQCGHLPADLAADPEPGGGCGTRR
jgi:hypothetical protein